MALRPRPSWKPMVDDLSQSLLARLNERDTEAAERVFRAYEPLLRMVVRRQLSPHLRAKFDSIDVVQSVWTDVLEGFRAGDWNFADANRLRAFLVRLTRNRFLDRLRHHEYVLRHERSSAEAAEAPAPQPRPSEEASAGELWQEMLDLCPSGHHELLRLKRQGHSLADIAARTGLHESSVRRILYDLASRLAKRHAPASANPDSDCSP